MKERYKKFFSENITIPLSPGDNFLFGKWKNKRAIVKSFGKNEKGEDIIITDTGKEIPLLKIRLINEKYKKFFEDFDNSQYLSWKRKNVTYRGIKTLGVENEVYGSWGKGLYTVPLSNKSMAKQYGTLYFVVNAIPKKPKIINGVNDAEMLRQRLVNDFCKKHGKEYSLSFFEANTSMEEEMLKLGFDGLIIKGREMVNYTPEDILYFQNENQLIQYYENLIS